MIFNLPKQAPEARFTLSFYTILKSGSGHQPADGDVALVKLAHETASQIHALHIWHGIHRRAGAIPGDAEALWINVVSCERGCRLSPGDGETYCFASVVENSPLRIRTGRPSTNFATASSP
jgi:hypothetical protein